MDAPAQIRSAGVCNGRWFAPSNRPHEWGAEPQAAADQASGERLEQRAAARILGAECWWRRSQEAQARRKSFGQRYILEVQPPIVIGWPPTRFVDVRHLAY